MKRLPAIEPFRHCNLCHDELVWSGDDETLTMRDAESWARESPEADWRVTFHAPLYEATYQRHYAAVWVLVGRGEGFA